MQATTVGHLRVRTMGQQGASGPALRLRADRLLAGVAGQQPGLAPGAVLIVRRLAVVGLSGPDLQERLADHLRQAVRPAWGALASTAGSVLFGDEAELLACLTREVLSGQAWTHWYWQHVWRDLPRQPAAALAVTWSSSAAALPAALRQLSSPEARAAVALLDQSQISRLVRSLHTAFAVPNHVLAVELPAPAGDQARDRRQATAAAAAPPPWQPWLADDTAAGLAPQAQYLLGLAMALAEVPGYARSPLFAARAAAWLTTELARPRTAALSGSAHPAASPRSAADDQAPWRPVAASGRSGPALGDGEARVAASEPPPRRQAQRPHPGRSPSPRSEGADGVPLTLVGADDGEAQPGVTRIGRERPPTDVESGTTPPLPGRLTAPLPVAGGFDGVTTGLGGVLYLINWLQRLDLPAGWTDPSLAEHVSGWALLEALARALLSTTPGCQLSESWQPALADDPLWAVLAALDGRPVGQAIGVDLPQPAAFRLAAAWLQRLGPAEPRWRAAPVADRLILWDVGGCYVVADVPLAGRPPAATAAAEAAAYAAAGVAVPWQVAADPPVLPPLDAHTAARLSPALAWIVQRLLGFLRHRLARALGCQLHEMDGRAAALLAVEGRLVVSRTHVDLYLPLERIDLAARRAGLDCDPGWVPDLGRIVSFHFV